VPGHQPNHSVFVTVNATGSLTVIVIDVMGSRGVVSTADFRFSGE
jgi:hypothetical protein